ncbi:hypothetical protein BO94DRAFT_188135 [Aspergillus sclerotioniger CBS 115572]|uniref:Uncharacterized protein n=1 Tax=Aspergillus sclerotioniger CBS 115572 TaxID=1450535 RepID=A0A317VX28_9EURO|nr:hypothetical protein BO94DRAFT_188135 [Aspergillus sclerotioniger CBS 115572]PWY78149.1 hypothetical protein BO94DRAFT_188135 [Aspergillus sclerotioniger CBS 115572]
MMAASCCDKVGAFVSWVVSFVWPRWAAPASNIGMSFSRCLLRMIPPSLYSELCSFPAPACTSGPPCLLFTVIESANFQCLAHTCSPFMYMRLDRCLAI